MIDNMTKQPLRVTTAGRASAFLDLPNAQVEEVRRLLDANRIGYSVDEIVISFDGGPEEAMIHLDRGSDASAVQEILDGVQ